MYCLLVTQPALLFHMKLNNMRKNPFILFIFFNFCIYKPSAGSNNNNNQKKRSSLYTLSGKIHLRLFFSGFINMLYPLIFFLILFISRIWRFFCIKRGWNQLCWWFVWYFTIFLSKKKVTDTNPKKIIGQIVTHMCCSFHKNQFP